MITTRACVLRATSSWQFQRDGNRASADSTLLASARIPLSSPAVNVLPTEASPVGCVGRASQRPASRLGLSLIPRRPTRPGALPGDGRLAYRNTYLTGRERQARREAAELSERWGRLPSPRPGPNAFMLQPRRDAIVGLPEWSIRLARRRTAKTMGGARR